MIQVIPEFLLSYPEIGYAIVLVAAFFEAVAFLGLFVPGTIIVIIGGFVAERWPLSFEPEKLVVLAALGGFLGAITSYLLGRYYGPPFFTERNFFLKRRYLIRAQQYFASYGAKSVFSGNFLGPVRSFVPFVAGMAEMRIGSFFIWSLAANVIWSFLYVGLGYFFGASWEAVELWGTRLTIFLFGLSAALALNWLVGRFLVRHERQVRAFFFSLGRSLGHAFLENEYIAAFIEQHPRLFRFVCNRFSPYNIMGLSLTISVIISSIVLGYLLLLIHAIIAQGPLLGIDTRLLGLVMFVRDPILDRIILFVTNLAGMPALGFIGVLILFLVFRGAWFRATVLAFGFGAATGLYVVLKWLFNRPRPDIGLPLIVEHSASFPSGHAVVAVIFFGFLTFVFLGYVRSWRTKVAIVLAAVFIVGMVGISRLYLGVHWPSDVLGGYLLGGWALVVMLTTIYLREVFHPAPSTMTAVSPWRFIANLVIMLALAGAVWFYWFYTIKHPPQTVIVGSSEIFSRRIISEFNFNAMSDLIRTTETISGRMQAPINLIIVGSRQELETTFRAARWELADPATLSTIIATVHSSLANKAYPTAPISPSFYDGRVQDLGVEKETSANTARQRHHARFWLAPVVLSNGRDIWFGTASFDRGVAYSPVLKFPTHVISPDIDRERDFIRDELLSTGRVTRQETMALVEPGLGTSGVGSPFFTDGQARVLWLAD